MWIIGDYKHDYKKVCNIKKLNKFVFPFFSHNILLKYLNNKKG